MARIVTVALVEPGPPRWWRWATVPIAIVGLLAAAFHPTFGGLILRSGFAAGGMSFLQGHGLAAATLVGAAAAAGSFGLVLGGGVALVRRRLRWGRRALAGGLASALALWFGAVVLAAPRALGFDVAGDWPGGPLTPESALALAGWMTLALGPHAAVVAVRAARGRKPGEAVTSRSEVHPVS